MSTSEPMPRSPRPTTWLGAVGLCLVVYVPGFFALPPVDRDESRFAQASRQMFESVALPERARDPALHGGGLVVPRVQGRDRLNKPPLIYWLQAGSAAVFTGGNPLRDAIWMYRVPSLLAAIAAVLLTWRIGASVFDARTGRLAAALLACCPVVAWEARQARADMVLLTVTTAAMGAVWMVWKGRDAETERRRDGASPRTGLWWPLSFWVALAAGILVKGPITPLIAGLAAFSLCLVSRRWRWVLDLRPVLGVVVLAVIVAPWVVAVGNRVGWDVYVKTVTDETLGRSVSAREGHWGPPGYHTLLLAVLFWPGSLMTAAGVVLAFRQGLSAPASPLSPAWRRLLSRRAGHPPYLFCLAWIVPAWVVFELAWTKLPHYTLPMYPAVALLSARGVLAAEARLLPGITSRAARAGRAVWCVLGLLIAVLALAVFAYGRRHPRLGGDSTWTELAGLIAGLVMIGAFVLAMWNIGQAWRSFRSERWLKAQLAGVFAFVVLWVALAGLGVPSAVHVSRDVAELLHTVDPAARRPLAAVGYHEDSMVFLTRGHIERIQSADLNGWLARHPDGLVVVPVAASRETPPGLQALGGVEGLNYSNGRYVRLIIAQKAPG